MQKCGLRYKYWQIYKNIDFQSKTNYGRYVWKIFLYLVASKFENENKIVYFFGLNGYLAQ